MLKSIVTTIWYRSFIWVWSSTPEHAESNSQYWITNMSRLNWGMMSILYIWVKETNWGSFFKWFNSLTLAFLCTVEIMIQHYLKGKLSFDTGAWHGCLMERRNSKWRNSTEITGPKTLSLFLLILSAKTVIIFEVISIVLVMANSNFFRRVKLEVLRYALHF